MLKDLKGGFQIGNWLFQKNNFLVTNNSVHFKTL